MTPLLPGESIVVSTPFRVKVPSGSISRLGHIGQSYQITQWYPKPAVYDKNGWNPMPYLNQGEFYSEFGSFDVSITIPENYVLGSTGDLQNASEIKFMNDLAQKTEGDLISLVAKSNKGISIIESLVCIVIIGIGFIAIMQLSAFTINSMDRATERNKLNYLSEMVMEDMIADPDNVASYGNFNETCSYSTKGCLLYTSDAADE